MIFYNFLLKRFARVSKSSVAIITTTLPTIEEARSLSTVLLRDRLAACVNIIGPILSFYEWEGKLEENQEYKLFIKTQKKYWEKVKNFITKNHSYSVPEISLLLVEVTSTAYQKWLEEALSK